MLIQFIIIFGCLALGELIVWLTGIKFPSCIIGMILLTIFLKIKLIKYEWVNKISNFLLENLAFFFVPPSVALMKYFDIIKAEWL
ncbi:MAG: CidA/LrgA family protein, partial [Bacteroidales bacterium]|nr:CidA/LrgA family protein [Bacteroidales bacterium]